ncbi:hypothetical protein RND81_05G233700 [Saponaria officinalis]|uniref:TF-B3 domain-containing protein n=1 Tax=Saponaria officinalis TaxID=3572 RepID=A0AAW1L3D0_SAPOF
MSSESSEWHACSPHYRGCSSKREKNDGESSMVASFFKIMRGKTYDLTMVVPPKISEKLMSLLGKRVTLENPDAKKWDIRMTNLDGSVAFQKGWHNFVKDNGVERGDFLQFNYFGDSRFFVDIFGSNGCQKVVPSVRRTDKNRMAKTATSSIPEKLPFAKKAKFNSSAFSRSDIYVMPRRKKDHGVKKQKVPSERNIHQRPKMVPVSETLEEPCFTTNREINFGMEKDRDRLLDLSAFEIRGKRPIIDGEEDFPDIAAHVNETAKCHPHEVSSSFVLDKNQNAESGAASIGTQTCPIPESSTEALSADNSPNADLPRESIIPLKNVQEPKSAKFSGGSARPVKQEAMQWKPDISGDAMTDSCRGDKCPVCEQIRIYCVEECCKNLNPTVKNEADIDSFVKPEPVDCDAPSAISLQVICSVPLDSEDFLVLPEPLPVAPQSGKKNHTKPTHGLVYLRDPAQRLWPVVYHLMNDMNVLASGWNAVMKANDIQPGDKCLFILENSEESFFTLQVAHN